MVLRYFVQCSDFLFWQCVQINAFVIVQDIRPKKKGVTSYMVRI